MRLGFVCGLADERRVLEDREGGLAGMAVVTGADPARAVPRTRKLVAEGATRLISFGLAGGLDPALEAGALVVTAQVVAGGVTHDGDTAWADEIAAALRAAGIAVHDGTVLGTDLPILSPEHKAELFADTGAAIVDMESAAVAEVCADAGLPFIVVRAIVDDAETAVPRYASEAIEEDGSADVFSVLGGLIGDPLSLPQLVGVAAGAARAYATLRRVAPFVQAPALQQ